METDSGSMDAEVLDRFIESWGSMGVLWGINRSMARVHALLIASEKPLALDDVAQGLRISRGNASMCLKELRHWGVIRRMHRPGDRRDYYLAESDVWHMFFRIANERKKREFDPALEAVRGSLSHSGQQLGPAVRNRLSQMEELLSTMDRLARRLLADETTAKTMFKFLTKQIGGDR